MRSSSQTSDGRRHIALGTCSLGVILLAASERGVCAIQLGDDADTLVCGLQNRFPTVRLRAGDPALKPWVARVADYVDAPVRELDLPLDIRGTAFQRRVWEALCAIPPGNTLSYSALARQLDVPMGARAVAGACAANPLAVAIPCHRVVRTDGSLSGYRWGLSRKRELLRREAVEVAR